MGRNMKRKNKDIQSPADTFDMELDTYFSTVGGNQNPLQTFISKQSAESTVENPGDKKT